MTMMNLARIPADLFFDDPFFRPLAGRRPQHRGFRGFRVEVLDKEDRYELNAELPGISRDAIDLTCEDGVLTISAKMDREETTEQNGCVYTERRRGDFRRAFSLEGIREEDISARLQDGVLTVTLPKAAAPEDKARHISITD